MSDQEPKTWAPIPPRLVPQIYQYPTALLQMAIGEMEEKDTMPVERIEYNNGTPGIYTFFQGEPFPHKGLPTMDAVHSINIVKNMKHIPWTALLMPKRALTMMAAVGFDALSPYLLKPEYQNPTTNELIRFLTVFLNELGYNAEIHHRHNGKLTPLPAVLAHIIEYDSAYRYRFLDLGSETTKETLYKRPVREIRRLISINRRRDFEGTSIGIRRLGLTVAFALCIPRVRRAFRAALKQADFSKLQLDSGDAYWLSRRTDYAFGI